MSKRQLLAMVLLVTVVGVVACGQNGALPATPTAEPTATEVAVAGPTGTRLEPTVMEPTISPVTPEQPTTRVVATETAKPTSSPTAPPSPTASSSPTPRPSPSPLPTATPTATAAEPGGDPAKIRVGLQPVVGGLDAPVGLANAGDGSGRMFILEKVGRIRVYQDGTLIDTHFLDVTDRVGAASSEQGLLGLAFHPRYAENGLFFVNYTNGAGDTVVSRFSVSADPGRADPGSEVVLLTVDQPERNHNGGHLAFGPDGFLYVGLGDGGAAGDRFGNGQNGQTLLGALLRLAVDGADPYGVPASNPFVGVPGWRPELWAIGLRNPWRFSFDRQTGDLWIADVGQNRYEEIDFQPAGEVGGQNYGWPIMEGEHCFPADRACERAGLTLPVWEYDHGQGCSVTGGYVYRGQQFAVLRGIYLFGDYCSGRMWGMAPGTEAGGGAWRVALVGQADVRPSAFGEDENGELYVLDLQAGVMYRITAALR